MAWSDEKENSSRESNVNGVKLRKPATDEHDEITTAQDSNKKHTGRIQHYLAAIRPWSFSASLTPVLLGTVLSWKETGHLNILSAILVTISIISVHAAGNLVNTYYDFLRGIDDKDADDQTLVSKILSPEEVVRFGAVIYVIGCVSFLVTLTISPSRIDHLALTFFVGLSGSFLYTGEHIFLFTLQAPST